MRFPSALAICYSVVSTRSSVDRSAGLTAGAPRRTELQTGLPDTDYQEGESTPEPVSNQGGGERCAPQRRGDVGRLIRRRKAVTCARKYTSVGASDLRSVALDFAPFRFGAHSDTDQRVALAFPQSPSDFPQLNATWR